MSLYIPNLSTDEFGPFVQGLADNFGALEGSQIVEYGENENGKYWRWESGLQICHFTQNLNRDNFPPGAHTRGWNLPAAFAGTYYLNYSVGVVNSVDAERVTNALPGRESTRLPTSTNARLVVGDLLSSGFTEDFLAIGRWK